MRAVTMAPVLPTSLDLRGMALDAKTVAALEETISDMYDGSETTTEASTATPASTPGSSKPASSSSALALSVTKAAAGSVSTSDPTSTRSGGSGGGGLPALALLDLRGCRGKSGGGDDLEALLGLVRSAASWPFVGVLGVGPALVDLAVLRDAAGGLGLDLTRDVRAVLERQLETTLGAEFGQDLGAGGQEGFCLAAEDLEPLAEALWPFTFHAGEKNLLFQNHSSLHSRTSACTWRLVS